MNAKKTSLSTEERDMSQTALVRLCVQLELDKLDRLDGQAKKDRLQKLNHLREGSRSIYQTKLMLFVNTQLQSID